jgi:hypothetical protein
MNQNSSTDPHVLDSLKLLILLARQDLNDEQRAAALELAVRIDSWEEFALQANKRFILPLVYRHLKDLHIEGIQQETLQWMKEQVTFLYQRSMVVIAAQRRLKDTLLDPNDISHVFFKGPSLALRYYAEPAMRFSRDIDVLIDHRRTVDLIEAALEAGFSPKDPSPLATDRQSLEFLAACQKVISMISPEGVVVEFHQRVENWRHMFDSDEILSNSYFFKSSGFQFPVMPTNDLAVYICFHHTKHFWSHLHWLVDLNTVINSEDYDEGEVLRIADSRGLRETVDACLEFCNAMSNPDILTVDVKSKNAKELLNASLMALVGGINKEHEMHKSMATPDFPFSWQARPFERWAWRLGGWLRIFRPSYADYRDWPLPPRWQWLYRPLRPWRESRRHFSHSRH